MNDVSRDKLDQYYAEAASWNQDRVDASRASKRVAWRVAAGAAVIAVLEGLALVLLMPLKTVEPYTLLVDRTTGYVQALKPMDEAKIAPDTALTQSFLVQYVTAREGFDMATLNADYRRVALFSSGKARRDYLQSMQAADPRNPLNRFNRSATVGTQVKSVSPLGRDTAMVRFEQFVNDPQVGQRSLGSWVAVMHFRFSGEPMKLEDRFVNPLGFQVTDYRKDPETIPAASPLPQPPAKLGQPMGQDTNP